MLVSTVSGGGEIERKFLKIHSGRVKNYLWERGIQLSDGSKRKKKAELFDLCKKAATMKQIKIASTNKVCKKLLKEKLQRNEGKFPVQKHFYCSNIPSPISLILTTTALNSLYS